MTIGDNMLKRNAGRIVFALLCLAFAASVLVILWERAWDDAAITLAYSRTLGKHGIIASSPYSDRSEGYSTFLWMLFNAAFFRAGLSETAVLSIARVSGALFCFANLLLVARLGRRFLRGKGLQLLLVAGYAFTAVQIHAIKDGMETALYGMLMLLSFVFYLKKQEPEATVADKAVFLAVSSLLILVRHEAVIFLVPFGLYELIVNREKVFKQPHFYVWAAVFFSYQAWHYLYFGTLYTNPMLAKANPVYNYSNVPTAPLSVIAMYRAKPFLDFFKQFWPVLAGTAASALIAVVMARRPRPRVVHLLILLTAFTCVFVWVLVGDNWGAAIRLSWPGIPFLLLLMLGLYDHEMPRKAAAVRLAVACLLCAFLVVPFVKAVAREAATPGVTVESVGHTGRLVRRISEMSGISPVTFAGPDMGGLLLFHGDVMRVLDLGLLCDPVLARRGYEHIPEYIFTAERPHAIAVHDCWAQATQLYKMREFYEQYFPCLVDSGGPRRQYIFIRRDVIGMIQRNGFEVRIQNFEISRPADINDFIKMNFRQCAVIK